MLRASLPEESKAKVDSDKLVHSVFLTSNVKSWWVHELMHPLEQLLVRRGVHPNTITWIGVFLTGSACVMIALDWLILGGWFLFFGASFDFLDGRVARISGKTSAVGGFLDSVLDRYMDGMMFFALAWLFRDSWMALVCLLAWFGSMTTSYVRAKAESLGLKASGGEMQRPERILYVGTGALFSGVWEGLNFPFREEGWSSEPYVLMAAVFFIAVVSNRVAIGRFRSCLQQLQSKS
jgi:CDP-diacylglycerol---glycerol-3-phosphate 3-phosphatidyltransferase